MLAFVVGVLFGAGVTVLILGFLAVVADEDERRQVERRQQILEADRKRIKDGLEAHYR